MGEIDRTLDFGNLNFDRQNFFQNNLK